MTTTFSNQNKTVTSITGVNYNSTYSYNDNRLVYNGLPVYSTFSNQTKNTSSYTNSTKNTSSYSQANKSSTTYSQASKTSSTYVNQTPS